MGGLRTESSALILGFTPRPSNAVLPLHDYESHAIGSLLPPVETGLVPSPETRQAVSLREVRSHLELGIQNQLSAGCQ